MQAKIHSERDESSSPCYQILFANQKVNPLSLKRRVDPNPALEGIGSHSPIFQLLSGSVEWSFSVESVYRGFPNPQSGFPTRPSRGSPKKGEFSISRKIDNL
jgi:hypothetical protein